MSSVLKWIKKSLLRFSTIVLIILCLIYLLKFILNIAPLWEALSRTLEPEASSAYGVGWILLALAIYYSKRGDEQAGTLFIYLTLAVTLFTLII